MRAVTEGELLWQPSQQRVERARLTHYLRWLRDERALVFPDYSALWQWSVDDLAAFWGSVWDFFDVPGTRPDTVLADRSMPGARWFPGARLNYAEAALRAVPDDDAAVVFAREDGLERTLTGRELRAQVGAVAAGLRRLGVGRGDRVVALLPNAPEALVAFLATASLGAVWSSCSPDFGARAVTDRFAQVEPAVLVAVDGYRYHGKAYDVTDTVRTLQRALPGLRHTVLVPYLDPGARLDGTLTWAELADEPAAPTYEPVPFDHPLWVLYSSGTTGLPKAIVQGHGGITLEHHKSLALHSDLGPGDRFFWFTTTGWMMWNLLVGGLLVGATVVLYDGSPAHPDLSALWRLAERVGVTLFGTSAPYVQSCLKEGLHPAREHDLSALTTLGSTGAPLSPEGFAWVVDEVGGDVQVASVSGGTDVCTAFLGSCPLLPVHAGELQCRMLGAKVEAFDERGRSVVDEVGELVLTEPLPSMPVSFWNDPDGSRLRDSYFDVYPGVWRHGDWVRITPHGSAIIYGRSDSTLNRGGVRMGTAEFYRVVEELPEVVDSLVIDTSAAGAEGQLLLFLVLAEGVELDDALRTRITAAIRTGLSPRHVPDRVVAVPEVPRTLNGKKCEVPVKKVLAGVPLDRAVSTGALRNPAALEPFLDLADR